MEEVEEVGGGGALEEVEEVGEGVGLEEVELVGEGVGEGDGVGTIMVGYEPYWPYAP